MYGGDKPTWCCPSCSTPALLSRIQRNALRHKPADTGRGVILRGATQAGIDNSGDAVDRDGGFRDWRGEDDPPLLVGPSRPARCPRDHTEVHVIS